MKAWEMLLQMIDGMSLEDERVEQHKEKQMIGYRLRRKRSQWWATGMDNIWFLSTLVL